jgi:microcystin-dependent protein
MSSPYISEIKMWGLNFAPRGWARCNGALLSIAQNTALFSLLGTTYGGNGQTTFALPDMRSRVAVGEGQGPGLGNYTLGQQAGTESVTLTTGNLPAHAHSHSQPAVSAAGSSAAPGTGVRLAASRGILAYSTAAADTSLAPSNTGIAGSSLPVSIVQPYLVLNFCIATQGIFPSRN